MRNRKLLFVTGLMCIALIGLMGVQAYWATRIIKENERNFNDHVNESLARVINFLEKKDIEGRTYNFFVKVDSGLSSGGAHAIIKHRVSETDSIPSSLVTISSNADVVVFKSGNSDSSNNEVVVDIRDGEENGYSYSTSDEVVVDVQAIDSIGKEKPLILRQHVQRIRRRKELIGEVWEELLIDNLNPTDRVDSVLLDSVLHKELIDRGIDIPFLYGVMMENDSLLFANFDRSLFEERTFPFKARLFPTDINFSGSYLGIFFPGKAKYLFRESLFALIISGIMILMIGISFWYVARMFLSQRKLNELKNDFIDNMTHELKTPLANIALATESLKDEELGRKKENRENYLRIIEGENKKLLKQVEEVLEVKDSSWSGEGFQSGLFNLEDLVIDCLDQFSLLIKEKNAKVKILSSEEFQINGDRGIMKRVICNLLDNAVKYGGDGPDIEINISRISKGIRLEIKDSGPGIPKSYQQLIFDKFFRIPSGDVHDIKGSGLGLSYVKRKLSEMGGSIEVESKLEKGSSFIIVIPQKMIP
jgi:two-component system, OmpR family, phosphate regulon sensor histidine kinase PhoR